jgi:LacI family transcriptional regulator
MSATIKDVALMAGVSIGTVSRVINNRDRVSPATRAKVQAAVDKLNFKPNQTAVNMIRKKTQTIGLIVPELSNEYWSALAEHIQAAAWESGYTLLLSVAGYGLEQQLTCIATIAERKVDGIIAGIRLDRPDERRLLQTASLPQIEIVSLVQKLPGSTHINTDQFQGAFAAVQHLIQLGHTDIAYIGYTSERELGYRHALAMNGIEPNPLLNVTSSIGTFQVGVEAVNELYAKGCTFTAIFCWNDMIALGAIQALGSWGLRVPDDVAVVGFDDIPLARLVKPALTTVRQPVEQIGRTAVKCLLENINEQASSEEMPSIQLSTELIVRESCGSHLNVKRLPAQ